MGSALIDRRTARLAVALAVAGSLMLTAGLGIWALSALSNAIPHSAHTVAWLAAVALMTAGVSCGVLMIVVLLGSGSRNGGPAEPSWRDPRLRGPRPPGGQVPGPPRPGPRLPPTGPSAHPGPAGPPDPGLPNPGLPPEGGQLSGGWGPGGWSSADTYDRPDPGPELDWPEPPAVPEPGAVAGGWSGSDAPHAEAGIAPDVEPAAYQWSAPAGSGFVPQPEPAADDWSGTDAKLRPGAVLGQAEWIVHEDDPEAGPEPGADAGSPPAEAAPSPAAAGRPAEDDPDDGPVHRVESAFNVWGRPGPDAEPAAPASDVALPGTALPDTAPLDTGPPDTAPPDTVLPDTVLPDTVLPDTVLPDTVLPDTVLPDTVLPDTVLPDTVLPDTVLPDTVLPDTVLPDPGLPGVALPDVADQGQPASSAPTTRDGVQHAAARLRDADLRPGADRPPEPAADVLEPAADLADQDLIRRPPAPRRSGPAPGWNPDSEEDWLRVLRGLRAPEDG